MRSRHKSDHPYDFQIGQVVRMINQHGVTGAILELHANEDKSKGYMDAFAVIPYKPGQTMPVYLFQLEPVEDEVVNMEEYGEDGW